MSFIGHKVHNVMLPRRIKVMNVELSFNKNLQFSGMIRVLKPTNKITNIGISNINYRVQLFPCQELKSASW